MYTRRRRRRRRNNYRAGRRTVNTVYARGVVSTDIVVRKRRVIVRARTPERCVGWGILEKSFFFSAAHNAHASPATAADRAMAAEHGNNGYPLFRATSAAGTPKT